MSILSALKQNNSSIDDLAKLPQAMIMQMAQKKQISQDMLAPILSRKAEMMDAVSRSKSLQPQPPVPTVMEQMMQKNLQAENPQATPMGAPQVSPMAQAPMTEPQGSAIPTVPDEVGVAQLPIPERQYAGGGIVAFAKGDLIDLEEDDDEEDLIAEYAAAMQAGEMAMARGDAGNVRNTANAGNAGVGIRYTEPMPSGGSKGINYKGGKHPYESLVTEKAKEYGVDPQLASYILNKETGGMKNPETARSSAGAMGIAQFMPATAKQYKINPDIPEEAAVGMNKHLRYLVDKYDDPKLAAIAYNWGEGNTNKWLKAGADMSKLPKETRNYVASLAQGGEIKHYAGSYESLVKKDSEDPVSVDTADLRKLLNIDNIGGGSQRSRPYRTDMPSASPVMKPSRKYTPEQLDAIARGQGVFPEGSIALPEAIPLPIEQAGLTPDEMIAGSTRAGTINAMMKDETTGRALPTDVPKTPQESFWDKFMAQNAADRADMVKQKGEDRNMALLAAGLGMMGGESPYAFSNIGKGGLSGVQYLSEANKQRAAQQSALTKNELVAQRYKELGETAKGNQAGLMAIRAGELDVKRGELSEKQRAHNLTTIGKLESNAQAKAMAALKTQGLIGMDLTDPNTMRLISEWTNNELATNKAYNKLYQETYGSPFDVAPTVTAGNVMKFDKSGKLIK